MFIKNKNSAFDPMDRGHALNRRFLTHPPPTEKQYPLLARLPQCDQTDFFADRSRSWGYLRGGIFTRNSGEHWTIVGNGSL
jgi:hypothetical protein